MVFMQVPARRGWTRRAILSSLTVFSLPGADERGRVFPSERSRFQDPTTEFEVLRLTSPAHSSLLPTYYSPVFSRNGDFLIYSSDRTGSWQVWRMSWKNGESRLLTGARELDPASPVLLGDARAFCCFDGPILEATLISGSRSREAYRVPEGWKRGGGLSVSGDGLHALLVEARDASSRLRLVPLLKGEPSTVVEAQASLSDPLPRPKRAGILYRQEDSLWLVNYDGQQNRRLRTAPGRIGPAVWSADGVNVLYLHYPEEPKALNAIREHTPDTNDDRLVAPTSQFVHFGRNADSSVFVGASGSKASPYVLILLRVTRRELTLCEHRASDPMRVSPIFSPDSQKVLFQSDRDGKPAIYAMAVDRLVEKTES